MSTGIGPKIKKIRELRNLTQEYVAENLEISQSYYNNRIENDQATLSFKRLKQIAAVLNVEVV